MWFYRLVELAFLGCGGFLLVLALRNFYYGSASKNWPQTLGRIIRSYVLVDRSDDGKGYTPQLEYEYTFQGSSYRGKRIRFGQIGSWSRKQAEGILAPFPEGSAVSVFVDPANSEEAVLIRGTSWGNLVIVLAGAIFAWFGYMMHIHATDR